MSNSSNIINTEILQIAAAVAREKNISESFIYEAMEEAMESAGKKKYGHEHDISVEIDKKTGEIKLSRILRIVEEVTNHFTEISLEDARLRDATLNYGDVVSDPLPPIDLGRVAAQNAKQVIINKVKEAEKEREYNEFKPKEGEIISIIVKRVEYGNVIADIGHGVEALLPKNEIIPNETFRQNDRIRACIIRVIRDNKAQQIILSRAANKFMAKLFMQEVPEIYDNIIDVKSVAREAGSRAKIAVYSSDSTIDPVGSCVGVRGSRVQAVINELQGEKIDIIQWSSDPAIFVVNALAPAEVSKVVIDQDKKRIEVIVATDQLSIAIGRRGQNVRLASQLTGWNIDVLTEDEESKRRIEEFNNVSELFVKCLNVEEVLAQLLAAEGFSSVEEISDTSIEELSSIEGFDEALAEALQNRATEYLQSKQDDLNKEIDNLNIEKELITYLNMDLESLIKLGEADVKTISDFADLATDEFFEIVPSSNKTVQEINDLIMDARSQINSDDE